jgi:ribonuclease/clavin/mitogillin
LSLYDTVLAAASKRSDPAPVKARDSAAVVPWRRSSSTKEIEVFWVRRAESLRFMGGWYSFPGGGLSQRDETTFTEGLTGHSGDHQGSDEENRRMVACAIRELFEEAGILPSKQPLDGRRTTPASLSELREELLGDRISLNGVARRLGAILEPARLTFAGRWITPTSSPIRFDVRFFLLEWPETEALQPLVVPGELEEGAWIEPSEAIERWQRGEVLIAPPGLYILRGLAEDGPDKALPRLQQPRNIDVGPFRRREFLPGVQLLPVRTETLPPATHTNAYVLGNRELVLVDPGASEETEIERLRQAARAFEQEGGRFTGIWLTHHHRDHIGAVKALREFLDVPVWAHALTAERVASAGIEVDREFTGGQRVALDGDPPLTLRVIHTPGHARGHLCFFEERLRAVLAGDLVAGRSTIVIDPPEGDMDDYLNSLQKVIDLEPRYLLPGHGPLVTQAVLKLKETIKHRHWREQKVLAAWRSGLRRPKEMLSQVYDDVAPAAYPLAERQILAHLERLKKLGEIE